MLTLILENSTEKGAMILAKDGHILSVIRAQVNATDISTLLAGQKPDLIACGTGPGSYTGIRVAAALAKSLAYGFNVPLLGFSSLNAFGPQPILFDARSAGFYALVDGVPTLISTPPASASSPHPDRIKKRFAVEIEEREVDTEGLAKFIHEAHLRGEILPFSLNYLSSP